LRSKPAVVAKAEPSPGLAYRTQAEIRRAFGSVSWCWPGWIPVGHVTMIAGPQGVGKSFLAASLIAVIGGVVTRWPDRVGLTDQKTGCAVLCDTEEMRGVYAERLAALGAHEVFVCPGDVHYVPKLPDDLETVRELAVSLDAAAVVVDSLSGGHCLDENSAAMRSVLQELVALAGALQLPVIVVHHTRKRSQLESVKLTLDRVRGSSAITQFCRSVIGCYRLDDGNDGPVRVEVLKSSFCKPPDPFGFTISDAGLCFCEAPELDKPMSATDRAAEWLRMELQREPQSAAGLIAKAKAELISERTLYRARDRLGIVTHDGLWALPYRGVGRW